MAASLAMTQPTIPQPRLSPPATEWDLPAPRRPIPGPGPPPLPLCNQVRLKARWERILEVGAAAPRRQARPFRQVPRPAMGAFDHIEAGTDVAELLERRRFEHAKQQTGEAVPAPPLYQGPPSILAGHHAGDWLLSATVLLIITDGHSLDWDPAKGPARQVLLPDLPPCAEGGPRHRPRQSTFPTPFWQGSRSASCRSIAANSLQPRACSYLICVLPLGGRLYMATYMGWPPRVRLSLPPPRGRFPYGKASEGGPRPIRHRLLWLHGRRLGGIPPGAFAT